MGQELDVAGADRGAGAEDLVEAVADGGAAKAADPGGARPAAGRLLARDHHGQRPLHSVVVGVPVARELVQLGAVGVAAGVLGVGVRGRGQPEDRVALVEADEHITLVDRAHAGDRLGHPAGGDRCVAGELRSHGLVVGVDGQDRGVEARRQVRLDAGARERQLGSLLPVAALGRQITLAAGEARGSFPGPAERGGRGDEMVGGPIGGGGEEVEAPLARHREARDRLVLGVERHHDRAPGLAVDRAPEEGLSGTRNLHLAAVVDGHDPGVGGVDVVASQDQGSAKAGSDRPVVDTHAVLGGDGQQGRGQAGVEDHQLHPAHAVRSHGDSARGGRAHAAGGTREVRDEEYHQGTQHRQAPRARHATSPHRAMLPRRPRRSSGLAHRPRSVLTGPGPRDRRGVPALPPPPPALRAPRRRGVASATPPKKRARAGSKLATPGRG